jgi:hypothetical protein
MPHRSRLSYITAPLLLSLTSFSVAAATAGLDVPVGSYTVTSQMIMPHLEEMRRISNQQTRCLNTPGPFGLFPVMDQPALHGCSFGYERADGDAFSYLLVCQTARVATGSATLRQTSHGVTGAVDIKMGGKNMTFSQKIAATRVGECVSVRE